MKHVLQEEEEKEKTEKKDKEEKEDEEKEGSSEGRKTYPSDSVGFSKPVCAWS